MQHAFPEPGKACQGFLEGWESHKGGTILQMECGVLGGDRDPPAEGVTVGRPKRARSRQPEFREQAFRLSLCLGGRSGVENWQGKRKP